MEIGQPKNPSGYHSGTPAVYSMLAIRPCDSGLTMATYVSIVLLAGTAVSLETMSSLSLIPQDRHANKAEETP